MTEKQILTYAIKGIAAEIEQLEKDIKQGYKFIEQIENGEKVKTPKTKFEILEIITEKDKKMKELEKEKFALSWQVEVEMTDQN